MTRCLRSNWEIWEIGKIINQKSTKKCHKNPVDDDPVPEVQLSSWGLEHHLAATCTHKTRFAIMSKRIYENSCNIFSYQHSIVLSRDIRICELCLSFYLRPNISDGNSSLAPTFIRLFTMQNFFFRWAPVLPFWDILQNLDKFCLLNNFLFFSVQNLGHTCTNYWLWGFKWARNGSLL